MGQERYLPAIPGSEAMRRSLEADPGARAARRATGISAPPPDLMESWGVPGGRLIDALASFLTGGQTSNRIQEGMFTRDPGPVDLLTVLAGGMTAKKLGNLGMRRLMRDPDPTAISKDLYDLSRGPIGRRQFFYRSSGAPKKVAEARVAQTPSLIEEVTKELEQVGTGAGSIPARRASILSKIEDEADLVETLNRRHGILNPRPTTNFGSYGRPVNRRRYTTYSDPQELASSEHTGRASVAGSRVGKLQQIISDSTERRLRSKLDTLSRTTPELEKEWVPWREGVPEEVLDAADEASRVYHEVQNKAFRLADEARRKAESKLGPPPSMRTDYDAGEAVWRKQIEDRRAYYSAIENDRNVQRVRAATRRIIDPLRKKADEARAVERAAHEEYVRTRPIIEKPGVDPIQHITESIAQFSKRISEIEKGPPRIFREHHGYRSKAQGGGRRSPEKIAELWSKQRGIAEDTLRQQASEIGGLEGEIAKEMVEAAIEGRSLQTQLRDSMVEQAYSELEKRTGVRVKPVMKIAEQVQDVADAVPTVDKLKKSLVRGLLGRFGVK